MLSSDTISLASLRPDIATIAGVHGIGIFRTVDEMDIGRFRQSERRLAPIIERQGSAHRVAKHEMLRALRRRHQRPTRDDCEQLSISKRVYQTFDFRLRRCIITPTYQFCLRPIKSKNRSIAFHPHIEYDRFLLFEEFREIRLFVRVPPINQLYGTIRILRWKHDLTFVTVDFADVLDCQWGELRPFNR